MEKISIGGIDVFSYTGCYKKNFFCGFTTRTGGFSHKPFDTLNLAYHVGDDSESVFKNHRLIIEKLLDSRPEYIYSALQVHGDRILYVNRSTGHIRGNITVEADSLITDVRDMPLMVLGADCNLIIIIDIKKRAAGVVHAGWKGTLSGVLAKTLVSFNRYFGSSAENILVFFGPGIRSCCYRVDGTLVERFRKKFDGSDYYYRRGKDFFLDLVKLNLIHLKDFGIQEDNVFDTGECTSCGKGLFSYRKENITGRQAAITMIY